MTTAEELPFRVRDRAVYLPGADALVLADLHLGKGEAAAVELPITGRVVERVDALVDWCDPGAVVLAGDVLHTFSYVSDAVADSFDDLRRRLADVGADLRVVAGNHDTSLDPLLDAAGGARATIAGGAGEDDVETGGDAVAVGDAGDVASADSPGGETDAPAAHRLTDGTLVCHGHEEPGERAERYVIGHDHPAIVIEGRRRPCYLHGEGVYRGADVVALPAFNPLATGTAVNRLSPGDPSSPLLDDVRAFRPVVWDGDADETYVFPPLGSSRAFL